MTAPAIHRPTPLDLARRTPAASAAPAGTEPVASVPYEPRQLTAEEAIKPGKLTNKERFRPLFQQGMRLSRMHPEARLVALTLLGCANFRSGAVHTRWRPTTEQLADATGLSTARVLVQLEVLTSRGWLYERTLTKGPRVGATALQLAVPAGLLEELRAHAHEMPAPDAD